MPMLGLGTWKSKRGLVSEAVECALETGYRHIDCAANYGNENEVGQALTKVFKTSPLKREDVWITSKLWNDAHRKEDVIPALKRSLQDLKLDYLDLYLIHWPVAFKSGIGSARKDEDYLSLEEVPLIETWEAMLKARKEGLVKHVGISNFSIKKIEDLLTKSDDVPEVNQVELHPLLQQTKLLDFCRNNGIEITSYSPLGSSDRHISLKSADEPSLLEHPGILEIAKKHGSSAAQVLIKWAITRKTAVIPKSTSKEHIISNLKSIELQLDDEDLEKIAAMDRSFRFVNGRFFESPGNTYKNIYDE